MHHLLPSGSVAVPIGNGNLAVSIGNGNLGFVKWAGSFVVANIGSTSSAGRLSAALTCSCFPGRLEVGEFFGWLFAACGAAFLITSEVRLVFLKAHWFGWGIERCERLTPREGTRCESGTVPQR